MSARLHARDFQNALALLRQIGEDCPTPGEFANRGVALLPRLVASEITTLSLCDLASGQRRVVSDPLHRFADDELASFDRHFFSHPLVQYHAAQPRGGAHRISDSMDEATFRATPLYADYYARIRIDHALALPLHVDSRIIVAFVFNRRRRDFSTRDRDLVDLIRPHLRTLYRQSHELEQARRALASDAVPAPVARDAIDALTAREREVLDWVAAGKSNAQVATILGTMPRTVAKHLERIYEKLGVESRTAAAMRAVASRAPLP